MLRKSPYILENFDLFYTKEWDRSNSLLNSQESITQALNFMQNLRLDNFDNSPARDSDQGMMVESKILDHNQRNQIEQNAINNGAMIDISSQVMKGQRMTHQTVNQSHNLQNKRSINYSAFDQTSSMLLQAPQEFFPQKKSITDNNTGIMKQLFKNNDQQLFHPESCTYCKLHFDQILMLKHTKQAPQQQQNQGISNQKYQQQNKLDSFIVINKKNSSNYESSMMNSEKSITHSTQKKNIQNQKQIQQTLFKFTNQKDKQQYAQNFNSRPIQDPQALFHQCKCCNRTVCFNCSKFCQRCENIMCPLPLCTTILYDQKQDIILCNDCVSNQ